MSELHFCWLEPAIFIPLLGALIVARFRDPNNARHWFVGLTGLTLFAATAAWQDFQWIHASAADDNYNFISMLFGDSVFVIDRLSAPLIPTIALLYFLTALATLRTIVRRFSFASMLLSESIALATFSTRDPWLIVIFLALGTLPPYLELRARGCSTRVYSIHMGTFVGMLLCGSLLVSFEGEGHLHSMIAILLLLGAVLIRCGIVPFHCWVNDLFEHTAFTTALLYMTPMVGAYAAVRLVLPIAPDWVLRTMGVLSLITSVYAACMALVQVDARRFFAYLFLSHSALVLVGLEMVTPIGLTGAFCVWLSVSLAMTGFGLTLRALEARRGQLSLADYQGLYYHTPFLAMCFALTGLASVGFPGTFGFVGAEILLDGAVDTYPIVGAFVAFAAALNGIAIVKAYFRLFTGAKYASSVSLEVRPREQVAVLVLASMILIGGLMPHDRVASRHQAAEEFIHHRASEYERAQEMDDPQHTAPLVIDEQLPNVVRHP